MSHTAFRVEYIHPEDGRFMSFGHSMVTGESTSQLLKVIKWAMNAGVELRVRPVQTPTDFDLTKAHAFAELNKQHEESEKLYAAKESASL